MPALVTKVTGVWRSILKTRSRDMEGIEPWLAPSLVH